MKDKDIIRELLVDSIHGNLEAKNHFEQNFSNKELLDQLVEFALDDYSSDASMAAAYWISRFSEDLLYEIEDKLLILQEYELYNICAHILVALGRIKSKKGLKSLIENKISPRLHWEAEALKYYLEDILKE